MEALKREKYADISASHHLVPLGIGTLGVLGVEAKKLLREVGHRVMEESGNLYNYDYLLLRISVVQQRNAEAVLGTSHITSNYFDTFMFQIVEEWEGFVFLLFITINCITIYCYMMMVMM